MPKDVLDSIRHNIIGTMEQETRTLKEELSKTTEILDQLPTSLNTYVEQVNTLKYIEFKKDSIDNNSSCNTTVFINFIVGMTNSGAPHQKT